MYKIRVKIFLGVILLTTVTMAARLMHLQVFLGDAFRQEYEQMLQRTEFLPARRGRVIDRLGRILAEDHPCHDLCLHYGLLSEDQRWAGRQKRRLRREFGLTTEEATTRFEQLVRHTWEVTHQAAHRAGVVLHDQTDEPGVIDVSMCKQNRIQCIWRD